MNLNEELQKLKKYIGTENTEFDIQLKKINDNFTSKEDKNNIDAFIRSSINETTQDLKEFNKEINLKIKLEEVSEIISISYLAKKYFNKSRAWLHQRINGNIVNGKPAKLTEEEMNKLHVALNDISKKIGSVSASL